MVELLIEDLASCPECGCLVLATTSGLTWDPCLADRRMVIAFLGARTWQEWLQFGQCWGLKIADWHECPPRDHSPRDLWHAQRKREDRHASPN